MGARARKRLPDEMTDSPRWVRFALRPRKNGKLAKVPIQLNGQNASSTNPDTWATYAEVKVSTVGDGLGWVLGDGIGCLDLDQCLVDGVLVGWAREVVEEHKEAALLIEVSPSGSGVHIFLPMEPGKGFVIRDGRNIEVYPPDSGRYICVTGNRLQM